MLKIIESAVTFLAQLQRHGSPRIHHSINSETAIQWCSIKYDPALKSHPNVKINVNYRLLFFKLNRTF